MVGTGFPGGGESKEAEHRHKTTHSNQRSPVKQFHDFTCWFE
jgi:hypothetical protein